MIAIYECQSAIEEQKGEESDQREKVKYIIIGDQI
jgi:hypothetical protein